MTRMGRKGAASRPRPHPASDRQGLQELSHSLGDVLDCNHANMGPIPFLNACDVTQERRQMNASRRHLGLDQVFSSIAAF